MRTAPSILKQEQQKILNESVWHRTQLRTINSPEAGELRERLVLKIMKVKYVQMSQSTL